MNRWLAWLLAGIFASGCSKCGGGAAQPAPSAAPMSGSAALHAEAGPGPTMRVKLPAGVLADANIRTATVAKEALAAAITLPGEIMADPDRMARISSPVAGRLEQVIFKEGSSVKKGDVIAVIRVPELGKIRSAYAATAAKAKAARSNADRLKILLDQRLTAEQVYVDALATADALDVEARALGEQLSAMGAGGSAGSGFQLTLRAPLAGTVVAREAVVGQPVSAEQIIGTVADLTEVWFLARVFEKDLGKLRTKAAAEVQLNAYPSERFEGNVEYIGRQIDPVARSLTARIRLVNRGDLLRVGLFGSARVATEDTSKANELKVVVPRSALTEIDGRAVIFVKHPNDEFERRDVILGEAAPGKVEVRSGIREGETIVVEGVFTLKSAALKTTFAEEE